MRHRSTTSTRASVRVFAHAPTTASSNAGSCHVQSTDRAHSRKSPTVSAVWRHTAMKNIMCIRWLFEALFFHWLIVHGTAIYLNLRGQCRCINGELVCALSTEHSLRDEGTEYISSSSLLPFSCCFALSTETQHFLTPTPLTRKVDCSSLCSHTSTIILYKDVQICSIFGIAHDNSMHIWQTSFYR